MSSQDTRGQYRQYQAVSSESLVWYDTGALWRGELPSHLSSPGRSEVNPREGRLDFLELKMAIRTKGEPQPTNLLHPTSTLNTTPTSVYSAISTVGWDYIKKDTKNDSFMTIKGTETWWYLLLVLVDWRNKQQQMQTAIQLLL